MMRVVVAGGTGFVGSALVKRLLERGDEAIIVSRSADRGAALDPRSRTLVWDELAQHSERLGAVDAIVNLAGESIDQRWTEAAKRRVLESRLTAAHRVAQLAAALPSKPRVVINASGISYYGTSLHETFDENSPGRTTDFLSRVVDKWESAADQIPAERLVKLRFGVVLGTNGGAFPKMAMPYRLFAGGRVGSGKQWVPWIHLDDMVRLLLFCLDNDSLAGPVNGVAPEPVTNDRFGRAIARAMGRPHWFPVPAPMMKALFGELSTLLLDGQRVMPKAALDAGFRFRYPDVDSAMQQLVGR